VATVASLKKLCWGRMESDSILGDPSQVQWTGGIFLLTFLFNILEIMRVWNLGAKPWEWVCDESLMVLLILGKLQKLQKFSVARETWVQLHTWLCVLEFAPVSPLCKSPDYIISFKAFILKSKCIEKLKLGTTYHICSNTPFPKCNSLLWVFFMLVKCQLTPQYCCVLFP
jgi:hypothetical protein